MVSSFFIGVFGSIIFTNMIRIGVNAYLAEMISKK